MKNNNSRLQNLRDKANFYLCSNDYKRAIEFYNKVLQIDPKDK